MATDLSKLVIQVSANSAGVTSGFRSASTEVSNFAAHVDAVGSRIGGLVAGAAALGVGLLGGLSLGRGFKLAADLEDAQVRMGVLLGSTSQAKMVLEGLNGYAVTTPFHLDELTAASTSLLATGSSAKMVTEEIKMLGDISTGANIPLGEFAAVYSKMRSGKFIQAEELNQLVGKGLPIYEQFAAIMGVSTEAVKGLASQNKITFPVLQQALVNLTAEGGKYNKMAEKLGETTNGVFSTLTDAVDTSLRNISQALGENLDVKQGMKALTTWIENFGKSATETVIGIVKWVRAHGELIITTVKVAAAIATGVIAVKGLILVGGTLVKTLRAIAAAQTIVTSLSGPMGWASLLVGAGVAAGAYAALDSAFDGIEKSAGDAAAGTADLGNAQSEAGRKALESQAAQDLVKSKTDAAAASVAALTAKYREQIDTIGMTAGHIEIYKLAQAGATTAQLQAVRSLDDQNEVAKKFSDLQKDLAKDAKKYADDARSPWEKLADELDRVNRMEAKGLLTADQATRVSQKLASDAAGGGKSQPKLETVERRFTAGFVVPNNGPQERLLREAIATRKAQEKTAVNTDKLVANGKAPSNATNEVTTIGG